MIATILMGLGLGLGVQVANRIVKYIDNTKRDTSIVQSYNKLITECDYASAFRYLRNELTSEEMINNKHLMLWLKKEATKNQGLSNEKLLTGDIGGISDDMEPNLEPSRSRSY